MQKRDNLDTFFLTKLQPYDCFCEDASGLKRYFKKQFVKQRGDNVCQYVLLLEYEPRSSNPKGPWLGIYYGVFHYGQGNELLPEEINFIQRYFVASCLNNKYSLSNTNNVFNSDMEISFGNKEYWDFWINLGKDESIEEACLGMMAIQEALLFCGFRLVDNQ